jgi:hypothetical protein
MTVTLADAAGSFNKWTSPDESGRLGVNQGLWVQGLHAPTPNVELRDAKNVTAATLHQFSFDSVKAGQKGDGTKDWDKGSFNDDPLGLHWVIVDR